MMPKELYDKFLNMWRPIALLGYAIDALSWDQATYMPKGESETRAEQMAMFADMLHHKLIDGYLYDILLDLESVCIKEDCDFNEHERANVREAIREIRRAKALPADLVAALAKETSLANEIWEKAREENSFKDFAPALSKIISLSKEKAAAYMASGMGASPYEALFFEYEDGIAMAEVDAIFDKLRADLPPIVKKVMSLEPPDDSFLFKYYPADIQEKVSREIITAMGVDWNRCRLDASAHPFTCSPAYGSPRITSRYDENNLLEALFSAIHEAGHALYEQGLPKEWAYQPIGNIRSLSIHESQSRFWDAWFGRSYMFWMVLYDKIHSAFPTQLNRISDEDFYCAINRVKPGFIRTDSDPLTYNLHILLRKDIEKMMIESDPKVNDLPMIWNELFYKYFGIEVPDDRRGILQDVHWSCGSIGYFPTYTLGNIISAQLCAKVYKCKEYINFYNFYAVTDWLKNNIHRHGSLYSTQELVKTATGQSISTDTFIDQIKKRYSDVYSISL